MSGYNTDGKTPVPQVLAQTWHTRVPVQLSLAPDNISSPSAVRPIYLMAPRQGYLNVVAAQAWPHLQHVLPSIPGRPGPHRPWFDCRGVPLRWHLPCGVLYDLLADSGQLPWRLTVHYTHPPDSLVGWDTGATPQAQFMNSLKEACYICRGPDGSGAVMRLGSAAQDELWAAVQSGDVAAYRASLEALRVVPSQRQGQPPNIPVRLFLRRPSPAANTTPGTSSTTSMAPPTGSAASGDPAAAMAAAPRSSGGGAASITATAGSSASAMAGGAVTSVTAAAAAGSWESCITATSRPVPSQQGGIDGEPTTLGQLLHIVLPQIFPSPGASEAPSTSRPRPSARPSFPSTATAATATAEPGTVAAASALQTSPDGSTGHDSSGDGDKRGTSQQVDDTTSNCRAPTDRNGSGCIGSSNDGEDVGGEVATAQDAQAAGTLGRDLGARKEEGVGRSGGAGVSAGVVMNPGGEGSAARVPGRAAAESSEATGPADAGHAGILDSSGRSGAVSATATLPGVEEGHGVSSTEPGAGTVSGPGEAVAAAASSVDATSKGVVGSGSLRSTPGGPAWPPCLVLVGGICPPLEAPIGWLHAAMHAPDMFLYVVVRMDGGAPRGLEGFGAGPTAGGAPRSGGS